MPTFHFDEALYHAKLQAAETRSTRYLLFDQRNNEWSVETTLPNWYKKPYIVVDRTGTTTAMKGTYNGST